MSESIIDDRSAVAMEYKNKVSGEFIYDLLLI